MTISPPWMMLGTCIKPFVRLFISLDKEAMSFDLPIVFICWFEVSKILFIIFALSSKIKSFPMTESAMRDKMEKPKNSAKSTKNQSRIWTFCPFKLKRYLLIKASMSMLEPLYITLEAIIAAICKIIFFDIFFNIAISYSKIKFDYDTDCFINFKFIGIFFKLR